MRTGLANVVPAVKGRMIPRLSFVGSSPETKDVIEGSFRRQVALLERTSTAGRISSAAVRRSAISGSTRSSTRPWTDPTPGAHIRATAPRVQAWIERMLDRPRRATSSRGRSLEPTFLPFLRDEVGGVFFPWSLANAKAIAAARARCGVRSTASRSRRSRRSITRSRSAALRARYGQVADRTALDPILERTGCLAPLRGD
jgi:hypothetical protein